jgi:prevent-host-death family protein
MQKNRQYIGLRELREKTGELVKEVRKGRSIIVMRRSEPLFKISPIEDGERWEEAIDFTKIRKGGIDIDEILKRI